MKKETIEKIKNIYPQLPSDYLLFLQNEQYKDYTSGIYEVNAGNAKHLFAGFLMDTDELNTDLIKWNDFAVVDDEYLIFATGILGESFALKVKGSSVGEVDLFIDGEDESEQIYVAKSFTEFLKKVKSHNL